MCVVRGGRERKENPLPSSMKLISGEMALPNTICERDMLKEALL
jgi:hypothetical protein